MQMKKLLLLMLVMLLTLLVSVSGFATTVEDGDNPEVTETPPGQNNEGPEEQEPEEENDEEENDSDSNGAPTDSGSNSNAAPSSNPPANADPVKEKGPGKPSLKYSTTTELVGSVTVAMEYVVELANKPVEDIIDEDNFTPIDDSDLDNYQFSVSDEIDGVAVGAPKIIYFRIAATDEQEASDLTSFTLYPRANQPSYQIDHVKKRLIFDDNIQYRTYESTADAATIQGIDWISNSSKTINYEQYLQSSDVTIEVRTQPKTGERSASLSILIDEDVIGTLEAPPALIDEIATKELISGFTSVMNDLVQNSDAVRDSIVFEYKLGTNNGWKTLKITGDEYSVTSWLTTASRELQIRVRYNEDNANRTPHLSEGTSFMLPPRKNAPTTNSLKFDYTDNIATLNVTAEMEWRVKGASDTTWKPGSAWQDISNEDRTKPEYNSGGKVQFEIRYAATADNTASKTTVVTLNTIPNAPSVKINLKTELVSGMKTGMELRYDYTGSLLNADWETAPSANFTLPSGVAQVDIRRAATSSNYASAYKTLIVPSRIGNPNIGDPNQPGYIYYDALTFTVIGVNDSMQYRFEFAPDDIETKWRSIGSGKTTIDVEKYLRSGQIYIQLRYKPASGDFGSNIERLALAGLGDFDTSNGGTLNIDLENEIVTGFGGQSYEYRIGSGKWKDVELSGGQFDISGLIGSNTRVLSIRVKASGSTAATGAVQFNLPKRRSAPQGVRFVYNNAQYYDQAYLLNFAAGMEYRRVTTDSSGNTTYSGWETFSEAGGVFVEAAPNSREDRIVLQVRYSGDALNGVVASKIRTVRSSYHGRAPSSIRLRSDGTVGALSASFEYSTDGGSTWNTATSRFMTFPAGTTSVEVRKAPRANAPSSAPIPIAL